MLKVTKSKKKVRVETGTAIFEWEAAQGGQLTRVDLKGYHGLHSLLDGQSPAPNLTLDLGDKVVSLAERKAEFSFEREDDECFVFTANTQIEDLFTIQQQYEV